MICKHCHREVSSMTAFCPHCGQPLEVEQPAGYTYSAPNPGPQPQKIPYNDLCIGGLIVSGLSIIWNIFGALSAVGLALSIIGLVQTRKTGQRGKELAIIGIVLGAISVILGILSLITAINTLVVAFQETEPYFHSWQWSPFSYHWEFHM